MQGTRRPAAVGAKLSQKVFKLFIDSFESNMKLKAMPLQITMQDFPCGHDEARFRPD
jgi:hypothetical protein